MLTPYLLTDRRNRLVCPLPRPLQFPWPSFSSRPIRSHAFELSRPLHPRQKTSDPETPESRKIDDGRGTLERALGVEDYKRVIS